MKKLSRIFLAVVISASLLFGINAVSVAGPVKLKAVSFMPVNHPNVYTIKELFDMLNGALKGKIDIDWVGGPEVIPARELLEGVRNNVVQIAIIPTAYYWSVLPECGPRVLIRYKNVMEMRKSGFHDFLIEAHKKVGLRYIGPGMWFTFNMWSKKPIKKIEDLKGMKMRSFFLYDQFQKAMGITPVTIPMPEVYTALERGVVDGVCFPLNGPRETGWTKSLKYVIAHPFYTGDICFHMNLDTWNKLPKDVQDKIEEVTAKKYEPFMTGFAADVEKKEWEMLKKAGVHKVTFSPEEAKRFVDTAYRVKWKEFEKNIPADLLQKLKKLTGN